MDTTKIKRALYGANAGELREVIRYAKKRLDVLAKRAYEQKVRDAWKRACEWVDPKDQWDVTTPVVYVCASGTFIGGRLQRGDALRVECIQRRKRIAWLFIGEDEYATAFNARALARYDVRAEPPNNPISDVDRRFADAASRVIARM